MISLLHSCLACREIFIATKLDDESVPVYGCKLVANKKQAILLLEESTIFLDYKQQLEDCFGRMPDELFLKIKISFVFYCNHSLRGENIGAITFTFHHMQSFRQFGEIFHLKLSLRSFETFPRENQPFGKYLHKF